MDNINIKYEYMNGWTNKVSDGIDANKERRIFPTIFRQTDRQTHVRQSYLKSSFAIKKRKYLTTVNIYLKIIHNITTNLSTIIIWVFYYIINWFLLFLYRLKWFLLRLLTLSQVFLKKYMLLCNFKNGMPLFPYYPK